MKSKVADSMVDECACSQDWTGTTKRTKKINKKIRKKMFVVHITTVYAK